MPIPSGAYKIAYNVALDPIEGPVPAAVELTITSMDGDETDVLEAVEIGAHAIADELQTRYPGVDITVARKWSLDGDEPVPHS